MTQETSPDPSIDPARARSRRRVRRWLAAYAVASALAIATLTAFLLMVMGQRDAAQKNQASANSQTARVRVELSRAQQQLGSATDVIEYLKIFFIDDGRLATDIVKVESECAVSSQTMCLADLDLVRIDVADFQYDRTNTKVPPRLSAADTQLRAALFKYIGAFTNFNLAIYHQSVGQLSAAFNMFHLADGEFAKALSAIADGLGPGSQIAAAALTPHDGVGLFKSDGRLALG